MHRDGLTRLDQAKVSGFVSLAQHKMMNAGCWWEDDVTIQRDIYIYNKFFSNKHKLI